MNIKILGCMVILLSFPQYAFSSTPTETLENAVNQLLAAAADKTDDAQSMKAKLTKKLARICAKKH